MGIGGSIVALLAAIAHFSLSRRGQLLGNLVYFVIFICLIFSKMGRNYSYLMQHSESVKLGFIVPSLVLLGIAVKFSSPLTALHGVIRLSAPDKDVEGKNTDYVASPADVVVPESNMESSNGASVEALVSVEGTYDFDGCSCFIDGLYWLLVLNWLVSQHI